MKPTQEQVIAWAREAGLVMYDYEHPSLERFAALAYEAGRKDENEECAVIAFNAKTYLEAAAAIRERGAP